MSNFFTALAILFWMCCGAVVGIAAMAFLVVGKDDGDLLLCPYGKLLGMPCWLNEGGNYAKYRVVAVSHKGAVAIRKWDDDSGKHAKWIDKSKVKQGCVRFGEDPHDTGEVAS